MVSLVAVRGPGLVTVGISRARLHARVGLRTCAHRSPSLIVSIFSENQIRENRAKSMVLLCNPRPRDEHAEAGWARGEAGMTIRGETKDMIYVSTAEVRQAER